MTMAGRKGGRAKRRKVCFSHLTASLASTIKM